MNFEPNSFKQKSNLIEKLSDTVYHLISNPHVSHFSDES